MMPANNCVLRQLVVLCSLLVGLTHSSILASANSQASFKNSSQVADAQNDCANTLHLLNDTALGNCEDDSVFCSLDPRVAANCCKCKPECCDQCNSQNSAWDRKYATTTICSSGDDKNSRIPGLVAYCVGIVLCAIACFHKVRQRHLRRGGLGQQQLSVFSVEEQEKRKRQLPSKFHVVKFIATDSSVHSLLETKEMSSTLNKVETKKRNAANDGEENEMNKSVKKQTQHSDIEKQSEVLDDRRIEKRRSVERFWAQWRRQPQCEIECAICLEQYGSGDVICVSKSSTCDHIFHKECIAEWLAKRNHCPLCRADLMSDSLLDE
eukprot:scaffold763_cov98-Cylindrotheca_fusiformis.AAC.9